MPSSSRALEPAASLLRRNAEEDEREQAQVESGADFIDQAIDAELKVAGHRRDFLADATAGADEQRQDEIARSQSRLAHQVADERMVPQATRTNDGELTGIRIH